jgi:uncharacterized protein with NRDE domain
MCTVTFVPTANGVYITSNRDEKTSRQKAIPPTKYLLNNKEIYFPKDPKAGGTWFAHDNQNVLVLLNGAEEKHSIKAQYRKSRGIILLDLIASENTLNEWKLIDLENIEPFTIVYYNSEKLYQLQWNEVEKCTIKLDKTLNHIWSSSTLYSKEIRSERKNWFEQFMSNNESISPQDLLDFHQFTENNNTEYGLQINRKNILKTVSITQLVIQDSISLNYIDLLD